jgi:hypothetical protein
MVYYGRGVIYLGPTAIMANLAVNAHNGFFSFPIIGNRFITSSLTAIVSGFTRVTLWWRAFYFYFYLHGEQRAGYAA